ncbi:MAG TPA: ABC transporter substrate-binding protein [Candidatus Binatia bacterium]|nr:ABC transporter substrate-binding protein [Candidatus Binatia bacterium]
MTGRRWLLVAALALAACGRPKPPPPAPPPPPPLRVGVTSDSPPFAARQGTQLVGIEVDFARELGEALGRPVALVDLPRGEQIPALLGARIDVAMAGLAVGHPGTAPVAFSRPYLRSGLLLLVRREDVRRYPTAARVLTCTVRIGVVAGTAGERFMAGSCPGAVVAYPTAHDAVEDLRDERIDALVHEAPIVAWWAAADEAELAPILDPLTTDGLGWAMRPEDGALRAAVDDALARWWKDGTRDRILTRWMPYWRRLEALIADPQ